MHGGPAMPSFHGHADFELKARDHRRNEVSRACKICMLSQGIIAVLISNAAYAGQIAPPKADPVQVFSYSPDGWQLTSQWVQEHYGQAVLDRWMATNRLGSWAQPDDLLNGAPVSSEDLVAWAALFTTIDPNLACTTHLQKAFTIINGLAFYAGIVTMLLVAVLLFVLAPTTANWDLLTCMYSIGFLIISGVTIVVAFVLASFIRSGSGTCDQIDPAFDNASNQFSNTASIVLACLGGLALLGTLVGFALWVVYVRVRSWREMADVKRPKQDQDDEASV